MSQNIPKKSTSQQHISRDRARSVVRKKKIKKVAFSIFILLIIAAAGAFIYYSPDIVSTQQNNITVDQPVVVALVDGDPITQSDIQKRISLLPQQYAFFVTEDQILEQLIDERILLAQAAREGVDASDEQVDAFLQNVLTQSNISQEEFANAIAQRGITIDDLRYVYFVDLTLSELLNKSMQEVPISEVDILDYYNVNIDQFTIPSARNVSHILICHQQSERCESNRTKEEAAAYAQEVADEVTQATFLDVAPEYSDEPAAQITHGNLGFISESDPFDQEFLSAAFSLNESEISSPLETIFGYHIIVVHEIRPEEVIEVDAVYNQINSTLQIQQQQDQYSMIVGKLRNESLITYMNQE